MMKKPFSRKLLVSRRGISMIEVVVSLALIAMITAAALSLTTASIQFEIKYNNEVTALRNQESIAACVRYAKNLNAGKDETIDALKTALGLLEFSSPAEQEELDAFHASDKKDAYTITGTDFSIILTVDPYTHQYEITDAA